MTPKKIFLSEERESIEMLNVSIKEICAQLFFLTFDHRQIATLIVSKGIITKS